MENAGRKGCFYLCRAGFTSKSARGIIPQLSSRIPIFRLRLRAVEHHELIGEHTVGIAPLPVRPLHADFRALGRAQPDMHPARVARGVAAADLQPCASACACPSSPRYGRRPHCGSGWAGRGGFRSSCPSASRRPRHRRAPRLRNSVAGAARLITSRSSAPSRLKSAISAPRPCAIEGDARLRLRLRRTCR